MTRREFIAAVPLGVAAASSSTASSPAMIPVIDTHQHLWDLTKFTLPWVKAGDALHAQHTSKEYAVATQGLNVVKAIYMEVGMATADQQREADDVIALCESKSTPTVAAVIAGNPASESFAKYVSQYKGHRFIKGIRHMLHVDGVHAADGLKADFLKGLKLLGELNLSFDLCIRPQELPQIHDIVAACPGTRFILDHCGNPQAGFTAQQTEAWKKGLAALAAKANVVCKVSGIIANGFKKGQWKADDLAPFVNAVLDTFGPDRVMFGGDWPVCTVGGTFAEWLSALRAIVAPRPEAEQRKLFHDNAEKCYGLKP
jgi:predicted TIM-barrel fold metal-dependent hydrolase